MTDEVMLVDGGGIEDKINAELVASYKTFRRRAFAKFFMAALGAIPWVGGFITAAMELKEDGNVDELQRQWLEHHRKKMQELGATLHEIAERLDGFGEHVDERLASEEFLQLVANGFRTWDTASTQEKREYVRRLLTNAAATAMCGDDLVRLFLDWINRYHESHFKIIRVIYQQPGATRAWIWQQIEGALPREDSAEADLFKLLIHDLSVGHVIRQHRATTPDGRFVKKAVGARRPASQTMKSAFDNEEPYELTALGGQFVHYVMNEVVVRVGEGKPPS